VSEVFPAFRACTVEDASTLAVIGAATLLEAFAGFIPGDSLLAHCRKNHVAEKYVEVLEHPAGRAWLAEVAPGACPVGYAMMTPPEFPAELLREGDAELRRIYVFTRFHGGGTGAKLMELAIAQARADGAKRLLLGVHPGNVRAIAFYTKNGFVKIGERQFHVGASTFVDPVLALTL
jgi:ribosomal protein S18 acetylase RimI-like enzyme